jgi:hypothetical protein
VRDRGWEGGEEGGRREASTVIPAVQPRVRERGDGGALGCLKPLCRHHRSESRPMHSSQEEDVGHCLEESQEGGREMVVVTTRADATSPPRHLNSEKDGAGERPFPAASRASPTPLTSLPRAASSPGRYPSIRPSLFSIPWPVSTHAPSASP